MAATLRRLGGGHGFGDDASEEVVRDSLTRFEEVLKLIDLAPFRQRRRRHRISEVVLPKLFDNIGAYLSDEDALADEFAAFDADEAKGEDDTSLDDLLR